MKFAILNKTILRLKMKPKVDFMFKLKIHAFFFTTLFLFSGANAIGQPLLKDPLQNYLSSFQPEKAYVHSNQFQYASGDKIFYKVYLMSKDGPSHFTKNIYAEWYDQDGKYLSRQILPSIMGLAAGDFQIPKKYTGQWVYMKLYTAWMQEQNPTPFLVNAFRVLQSNQAVLTPDDSPTGLQIKAEPEGGIWIQGIPSILTIRTRNGNDLPLAMNCRIVDANGQVVSLVSTAPYGWGQVEITPTATDNYYIQAEMPNGTWAQQALPKVVENGVSLRFDPVDHSFIVQRTTGASLSNQKLIIAIMHKDELLLETSVSLQQKLRLKGRIRTDSFPSGFHRLIWFDEDKNILGQRVFFLDEPKTATLSLKMDTLSFEKKGSNVFTILTDDSLLTSLSLSVTDADFDKVHPINSIYQLMGTDIFQSFPSQVNLAVQWAQQQNFRAIDQWLQAQDIWYPNIKDAIAGKLIPINAKKENSFITISGQITNLGERRTKKAGTMNLILSTSDEEKQMMSLELENDGSFKQEDVFYYDSISVYLQPNKIVITNENKVHMQTNLLVANPSRMLSVPTLRVALSNDSLLLIQQKYAAEKRFLDSLVATKTLEDVVVTTRVKSRIEIMDEKYATGMFTSDGIKFDIAGDNSAMMMPSVFAYLQGRVAGLQVRLDEFGTPTITWRGDNTAVFLNEVQLQDTRVLNNIPMADVAFVKVFRPPFYGAYLGGSGGAIVVYTKKGDEPRNYDFANLRRVKLEGYSRPTNWETSLVYDDDRKKPNKDIRKTLYWNPSIQLDKEVGAFKFQFNNNDITTRYRVIAEGFNKEGKLIRYESIVSAN
ncbi:hypothetical protein [Sediminibacterium sp.]|uniref:hypothetical protein n=1 Tax=Sediminibacterium sp. TaxID=1917865 RepID=UPI003F71F406